MAGGMAHHAPDRRARARAVPDKRLQRLPGDRLDGRDGPHRDHESTEHGPGQNEPPPPRPSAAVRGPAPVGRGAGTIMGARRVLPDRAFDAVVTRLYS